MGTRQDTRFTAEKTLGKLAKLLRLLGFDTLYEPDVSAGDAIDPGETDRILLTRTKSIRDRFETGKLLFIQANDPLEQVKEVIQLLGLYRSEIQPFSRCLRCNMPIEDIDKASVRGKVPDYIWEIHHLFRICRKCDKIYWPGSHVERSEERIKRLFDR
ncbi:MAG: Mut7-C RNAse domain-containing protein [Deltaproteobacteria bacterium]|nr:Mut7-C RNAse domain-containing protein [Deltaproteobacteria bacterium]